MPLHDYDDSELEIWLRSRHMKTNDFVALIGCSRTVIWRVKKGFPISPLYAAKISDVTKGEVQPLVDSDE